MSKPIIILGNGGHAKVLIEILQEQNREIVGFTAPFNKENSYGFAYLGKDEEIFGFGFTEVELVNGLGSVTVNPLRKNIFKLFKNRGYTFANVIHPSSIISPSAIIGEGVQIMAGTIIQTNAFIADNTIINTGVKIDHDSVVYEHVHIAPGTTISGNVHVRANTHIGTGTSIIQGITIGEGCLIGAGSVIVKDIRDKAKAFGVPAKEV